MKLHLEPSILSHIDGTGEAFQGLLQNMWQMQGKHAKRSELHAPVIVVLGGAAGECKSHCTGALLQKMQRTQEKQMDRTWAASRRIAGLPEGFRCCFGSSAAKRQQLYTLLPLARAHRPTGAFVVLLNRPGPRWSHGWN